MSEGKVSSGQPFYPPPARIWNNMIDAGQAFADGRFNQPAGPPIRPRETDILKLKNSSGANRRQGEVLKISGKVIETVTDESIWLNGIEPTAACRFGILKRPLLIDEVDNAQVSGVCIAKVNITDTSHKFADVAAGEYVLQSGDSGPLEILYAPSETGEADCVVRFSAVAGSGGEIIQFRPVDVCEGIGFTCDCVTAEIVTATCGSGLAPGDEVQVWDQSRGWFQMPEALLFNSIGWAHKVKITETDVYDGLPFYLGECRWVVISMDCIEQEPAS